MLVTRDKKEYIYDHFHSSEDYGEATLIINRVDIYNAHV